MTRAQIVQTLTAHTAALASKGSPEMEQLVKVPLFNKAFSFYSHKTKVKVITQANHITHTHNTVNQSKLEVHTYTTKGKCKNKCASVSRLLSVLLLIGSKSGAKFSK